MEGTDCEDICVEEACRKARDQEMILFSINATLVARVYLRVY